MKEINVKALSDKKKESLKEKIRYKDYAPKLIVIQVGNDNASDIYIRNKKKACTEVGIEVEHIHYKENVSTHSLLSDISALNTLEDVTGILVQLPLPKHIDENAILTSINPKKDVDGFSPYQTAKLYNGEIDDNFLPPCTAQGIINILESVTKLEGKNVVVIGRSHIVGKPVAHLLLNKNATVTVCHSKTKNLKDITANADIIITAIGKPYYFDHTYFKKDGQILIDAGINKLNGNTVGDINIPDLKKHKMDDCYTIYTPVPRGVGIMTVTTLLENLVKAQKIK